jgi:hypothetical protein
MSGAGESRHEGGLNFDAFKPRTPYSAPVWCHVPMLSNTFTASSPTKRLLPSKAQRGREPIRQFEVGIQLSIESMDAVENGLPRSFLMPRCASSAAISLNDFWSPFAAFDLLADEHSLALAGALELGYALTAPRICRISSMSVQTAQQGAEIGCSAVAKIRPLGGS